MNDITMTKMQALILRADDSYLRLRKVVLAGLESELRHPDSAALAQKNLADIAEAAREFVFLYDNLPNIRPGTEVN